MLEEVGVDYVDGIAYYGFSKRPSPQCQYSRKAGSIWGFHAALAGRKRGELQS
jgi:hypothetical protein